MKKLVLLIILMKYYMVFSQNFAGVVLTEGNKKPIEYANIGIIGKNIGTVSDLNGNYNLVLESQFDNDTLLFSSIGYMPLAIKIADLKNSKSTKVFLKEKVYEINAVIVKPKTFKQKNLGVNTHSKLVSAGFKDNLLGYEFGILMKVKKSAIIKKVNINIARCSYDSLFYRLNIYKVNGKLDFENILSKPIYINISKENIKEEIQVNLESYNIAVDGDFLVTMEHVKNLGDGYLYFCAGLSDKTYHRKTSQGKWETAPVGISISVVADVEK